MPCDFCSYEFRPGEGRWIYDLKAVASMHVEGQMVSASDPWWAACDVCEPLIRNANRRRLALRALRGMKTLPGLSYEDSLDLVTRIQDEMFWRPWIVMSEFTRPLRRFD